MLAGNLTALLSPLVWILLFTYIVGKPQKYDWVSMKTVGKAEIERSRSQPSEDPEVQTEPRSKSHTTAGTPTKDQTAQLDKAAKVARWMTVSMTLAFLVLWPMPLFGSGYVFSRPFFTGWVVVGFIWLFFTTACVGVYPLFESRKTLAKITKAAVLEVLGIRKYKREPTIMGIESAPDSAPIENEGVIETKVEKM